MYRSVGCITGLGELCCVCVCPQLGGEVGEVNAMEKKMRIILTAGAVCVLPISISFPAVSYSPIVCVCVCYNLLIYLHLLQAVFMYWIPNTILVSVQMLLLKRPSIRTALGIPLIERRKTNS